ncbi:MAG: hypothetical protein Q8Q09_02380 [Deltaproteobacteria bacterium]|nr:hypothetical protein [Deltaproteobacteria bacterium]
MASRFRLVFAAYGLASCAVYDPNLLDVRPQDARGDQALDRADIVSADREDVVLRDGSDVLQGQDADAQGSLDASDAARDGDLTVDAMDVGQLDGSDVTIALDIADVPDASCGACRPGDICCGGRCVTTTSDPTHCGMCGRTCANNTLCTSGMCTTTCSPGFSDCDLNRTNGCEQDTQSSLANCGACGRACTGANGTSTCTMGACSLTCNAGFADCDMARSNGCETDTNSSVASCGACGRVCGGANSMGTCTAGSCSLACAAGFANCDGNTSNGCELDVRSNVSNCGGCGTVCRAPLGGSTSCVLGICQAACPAGQNQCGTSCVNLQTSATNCGGCGVVCGAGTTCVSGTCRSALNSRYAASAPSPQTYIDACAQPGRVVLVPSLDDSVAAVTLPFALRFWSTNLLAGAPAHVSTNGYLQLNGAGDNYLSGSIPAAALPNAIVAPYFFDNYTNAAGICVATVGSAPNRRWVIEWRNAYHCCSPAGVDTTYEIVISETSNLIDFVYGAMTGARASTVGLEDQTGMLAVGGCTAGATNCAPLSNTSVRFSPIP